MPLSPPTPVSSPSTDNPPRDDGSIDERERERACSLGDEESVSECEFDLAREILRKQRALASTHHDLVVGESVESESVEGVRAHEQSVIERALNIEVRAAAQSDGSAEVIPNIEAQIDDDPEDDGDLTLRQFGKRALEDTSEQPSDDRVRDDER